MSSSNKIFDANLAHLSLVVGRHLKQLDNILNKVNGRHRVKIKVPKKLNASSSGISLSNFPSGLLGSALSHFTGGSISGNPSSSSSLGASGSRNSSGQLLADLASAISKAIKRDL